MKLGSASERRKAKEALKKCYLQEFQLHTDYTKEELKEMNKVVKHVNGRFE